MKTMMKIILGVALGLVSTPAFAQNPTVKVPMCLLQYQNAGQVIRQSVPCTGTVPVDSATGDALSWQDLFDRVAISASGGLVVDKGANSGRATPIQNTDGTKLASEANIAEVKTALGTPFQAGGSIANTAFGISGTLPAFAATPTVNLGAIGNIATTANIEALRTALGTPLQTGGLIGNTSFGATQSGTWSVGINGTVPVTGTFYQAIQPVSGTVTANLGTVPTLTSNVLGAVSTAAPTYTNGTAAALSLTPSGALRVDIGNSGGGSGGAVTGTVTANIGTTNGLSLDATTNSLFKAGQSIGNTAFGATQSGTWNVGVTGPVAVTGTFYQATQPVSGTVTANLGTVGGLATDTNLTSVKTALGTPFQAGGSIGNTGFAINGTLPAFAATPTVNLGTIAGAATDAKVEAVRALLAGTVKVDNGVALDGQKNATVNLSSADRLLLTNIMRGTQTVASFAAMTVGTAYDPGNGIGIACTAEGNVVLQGFDDSTITVPVSVGYNQFAFAIKRVVSQTATCTFTKLS